MWQQSEGKAYFTGAPTGAALKVSFFGPLMAVITLLHSIGNTAMRWFAARTATTCGYSPAPGTISDEVKQEMLAVATREGFDVSKFIWVQQPGS